MKYIIELSDQDGKSCRIKLALPLAPSQSRPDNSTWRVLDEGFFKFRSGGCHAYAMEGTGKEIGNRSFHAKGKMVLYVGKNWLIRINEFTDNWGLVNSTGDGEVKQEDVVNFKPGKFTWTLIE